MLNIDFTSGFGGSLESQNGVEGNTDRFNSRFLTSGQKVQGKRDTRKWACTLREQDQASSVLCGGVRSWDVATWDTNGIMQYGCTLITWTLYILMLHIWHGKLYRQYAVVYLALWSRYCMINFTNLHTESLQLM